MNKSKTTKLLHPSVTVIVPVYNSETTLTQLVNNLQSVLQYCTNTFEIILVNDGSQDNSWKVIADLSEKNHLVRGINLTRNFGQHNALLAGVHKGQHEIIVTLDDDLQHSPDQIPQLLKKLSEGYDIVYAKPSIRKHSIWRNVASKILRRVLSIVLGVKMAHHCSSYRAFRSILLRGLSNFKDSQLSIDVLLSWSAERITHIRVHDNARVVGKSGYTLQKLLSLSFNIITGYSTIPLRIASWVGLMSSLLGLSIFLYVVIRRVIQTKYVPGFAFIASEIALFAGLLLFAIGVIGEYVARLHFRTMGKPPYVIREEV